VVKGPETGAAASVGSVAVTLSDHLKSGQRLALQNRPMEDAGTQVFYPITGC